MAELPVQAGEAQVPPEPTFSRWLGGLSAIPAIYGLPGGRPAEVASDANPGEPLTVKRVGHAISEMFAATGNEYMKGGVPF